MISAYRHKFVIRKLPLFHLKYSAAFAEGLKNYFEHSTVVIALQSVRKVREIQSSDKPQKPGKKLDQMDMEPLTKHEVKLFELKTCVRMSSQLHELQKNLEVETEKAPFQANLTYKKQKGIAIIYRNIYSFANINHLTFYQILISVKR